MDADTRKEMGTNASKPLNMPGPLFVEEDPAGSPIAVKLKQRHTIVAIEDFWRIDDEWWRTKPVSRMYYVVILESGRRMILSKNLIDKPLVPTVGGGVYVNCAQLLDAKGGAISYITTQIIKKSEIYLIGLVYITYILLGEDYGLSPVHE